MYKAVNSKKLCPASLQEKLPQNLLFVTYHHFIHYE